MKITTLFENQTINPKLKSGHGLSLYFEFAGKKILFDIGPNKKFWSNAKKLGISLKEVDFLILSHGHYDHGTALAFFLKRNTKAKVYASKHVFDKHIGKWKGIKKDIGIKEIMSDRIVFIDEDTEILKGLKLITNVDYKETVMTDSRLHVERNNELILDSFDHEIYLSIVDDNNILVTGCSHKGIQNIVDTIEKNEGITYDYVIGGFHLKRYNDEDKQQKEFVVDLANDLARRPTTFITCHCTGEKAYNEMNQIMNNLQPLHTGSIVDV